MLLIPSDIELARRLEAAEAANGFAMARVSAGAQALDVMGGCALFAGAGSPLTHALGIAVQGPVSDDDFDRMENFFRTMGADSLIDLCPLCDLSVVEQIRQRGYRVIEFNNVMVRALTYRDAWLAPRHGIRVRQAEDMRQWSRIVAAGFAGAEEAPAEMLSVMESINGFGEGYLAFEDGVALGGAAIAVRGRVAHLSGDATLIRARRRGVQSALIAGRLARAAQQGCDLAMATVLPGSASQRNYERAGFLLVYTRANLLRELVSVSPEP